MNNGHAIVCIVQKEHGGSLRKDRLTGSIAVMLDLHSHGDLDIHISTRLCSSLSCAQGSFQSETGKSHWYFSLSEFADSAKRNGPFGFWILAYFVRMGNTSSEQENLPGMCDSKLDEFDMHTAIDVNYSHIAIRANLVLFPSQSKVL
jgi:hypothetical protein